jgi:DNA-binding NtrC family response regulator
MDTRILIVEDEEVLCKNMILSLTKEGFHVRGVNSAQAAWSVLNLEPITILLVDIGLPDCHGLDFLQQVQGLFPSTIAIVLTGWTAPEAELQAYRCGARAFLRKPFMLRQLRDIIHRLEASL